MPLPPDLHAGFRRVLYEAMTLCASLRAVRECSGYPKPSPSEIDGNVEAAQMNAIMRIRSLNAFLTDARGKRGRDMVISDFGFAAQGNRLPENHDSSSPSRHYRSADTYGAHMSWDAVFKDESVGAAQWDKRDIVLIGLSILDGFEQFWADCRKIGIGTNLRATAGEYAEAYEQVYTQNNKHVRSLGS